MLTTTYGNIPVPYPVMWSDENEYTVAECPYFHGPAICQKQARGSGVPKFGQPNATRQRKAIALMLCDVCGKQLKNATKISLSNYEGPSTESQPFWQIEPVLHVDCAKFSIEHCPALKRQLAERRIQIKRVLQCRPRALPATAANLRDFVPSYRGPGIIGLAAIDVLKWRYTEL